MGRDSGFRGVFVERYSGFREERLELSWGGIRAFVGCRGSDSGFRGEGSGLS